MKMKYKWTPERLERRGRYLWSPELITVLYQHLGVKPGIVAVDVGCGTGFFTRIVAKGMQNHGRIIGVDVDKKLLVAAQEIAQRESLSSRVEFKKGNAYNLPLPNDFADVVVCHTLLYIPGKPMKAINEMVRVAKVGGRVAAVESDYGGCVIYDPFDKDYVELAYKFNRAVIGTFKRLYGADLTIGSKLPSLFLKAGLVEISAQAYLLPTRPPTWDNRYSIEELVDYYKNSISELSAWSETEKKVMEEYGVSRSEFDKYQFKTIKRIKNWIKNPLKMRNNGSISARCFFVVVGKKQQTSRLSTLHRELVKP